MTGVHLAAAGVVFAYGLLCWFFMWRNTAPLRAKAESGEALLIGFASQSGEAERLARYCADTLGQQRDVLVLPLNQITQKRLEQTRSALFFVSTYGEGEPPDNALRFYQQWLRSSTGGALKNLHFAVLALGDSHYRKFCAFGELLYSGLRLHGAVPLFELIKADRLNAKALALWQQSLAEHGLDYNSNISPTQPIFSQAKLNARVHLNPGSAGGSAWRLSLTPPPQITWQAGDIAQILPCNNPENPIREYSIASIPEDGAMELCVRQVQKEDGTYGLGSGWLTRIAKPEEPITLRVRKNPAFHAPTATTPMIFIGNGTGIAGLRSLLKERALEDNTENILFYGERNRHCDYFFQQDIEQWQAQGVLHQVHLAFSRDQAQKQYVQHLLTDNASVIKAWVNRGAAIYVCGSLEGMAAAVDGVLVATLGGELVTQLKLDGRYRRDVY